MVDEILVVVLHHGECQEGVFFLQDAPHDVLDSALGFVQGGHLPEPGLLKDLSHGLKGSAVNRPCPDLVLHLFCPLFFRWSLRDALNGGSPFLFSFQRLLDATELELQLGQEGIGIVHRPGASPCFERLTPRFQQAGAEDATASLQAVGFPRQSLRIPLRHRLPDGRQLGGHFLEELVDQLAQEGRFAAFLGLTQEGQRRGIDGILGNYCGPCP